MGPAGRRGLGEAVSDDDGDSSLHLT